MKNDELKKMANEFCASAIEYALAEEERPAGIDRTCAAKFELQCRVIAEGILARNNRVKNND